MLLIGDCIHRTKAVLISQLHDQPESNHMMPCSNQTTGMLSESTGKGIDSVIVSGISKDAKLAMNRQPLVNGAYRFVSSLYAQ